MDGSRGIFERVSMEDIFFGLSFSLAAWRGGDFFHLLSVIPARYHGRLDSFVTQRKSHKSSAGGGGLQVTTAVLSIFNIPFLVFKSARIGVLCNRATSLVGESPLRLNA